MNEEIYEKYASKIYKYIYALCKDNDIAEEILQDTFYKAIKSADSFQGNSTIYTWLCTIAKNSWRNYLIRKKKIKFVPLEEEILSNIETEGAEDKQGVLEIYKAMHKLEPMTKEIMLIKLHSSLTFKEIGNLFGKSEQWARTKYYRGKLKMREELKDE